ncbi:hypothetical protein BDA96_04G384100 [Sorghum bicolor]|uniref:Ubiquitin-like protease family profile domain-containing protein n=1 Tax=Sorghum bicolor TaxID=4558 RepID=A0A921R999_SORBI|nr:hypothetical protein BDA96_04G384100 [Sorghum bicolor]
MLKKKLISSLSHNVKKKPDPRPKVGFSRFSVSTFSSVIKSLSTNHQDVIRKYGNFVHWVARLVNFNSGDIVVNGKVISLTKEAVHLVLDLPFGGEPFPTDYASGKACLLSRFGKDSVPPISYFSEALISKKELSDDDMFVCFIVVALSTFLCPNSSVVPSQRFFGIFEDLEKIRSYDWCGFILSWLLEYIKLFNQLKGCKSTHQATLGGCLYFLAVLYLDHVDFGSHQVPSTIPRISVWKKDMITRYASLDLKEEGCYGYHPIMDYSRTCYAKDLRLLPQIRDQHIDPEFVSQLDRYARCKLPAELKDGICNLIEKHCLNCGVSVNFDVNSINALSDDMRLTFIKLWKHVYSVTKMSQHLVLEVIKLLSEGIENDENLCYDDGGLQSSPVIPEADPTPSGRHDKAKFDPDIQEVHPSQFKLHRSTTHDEGLQSSPVIPKVGHMPSVRHRKAKFDTDIEEVHPSQFKLHQSTTDVSQYNRAKAIDDLGGSNSKVISNSKNPLVDVSNLKSVKKSSLKKSVSIGHDSSPVLEVVDLENKYVPDSISPASVPGFSRYFPQKSGSLLKKAGLASSSAALVMQTLDFTQISPSPHEVVRSSSVRRSGGNIRSSSRSREQLSPDVKVVGSKNFVQNVGEMTKKSNALYNSKLDLNVSSRSSPVVQPPVPSDGTLPSYARLSHSYVPKSQALSSGGKVRLHGPRRFVNPGPLFRGDYETDKCKFYKVNKSEVDNYKILCVLASSEFQNEDAVSLSGVRCTFWSLGESLKPGGFVNTFVVSCFCYSLFSKPNGHPDFSKRHYFFSNIGDNLLLDFDQADQDLLMRSFRRSAKARPLPQSNMKHWFVFVVDIKDRHFVFLDSYYDRNSQYHQDIEHRLINSFQYHWDKFVQVDMDFSFYGVVYPKVPEQPLQNSPDSGIYAMMFLEYWTSPRVLLGNLFNHEDIPSIRIKIANELFFHHKNTGMKHRVYDYKLQE